MSIRPVDFGGMIQRTDDVGVIKHQEDQKAVLDQSNIATTLSKQEDTKMHQVQTSSESAKTNNNSDAKEQGKGSYHSSDREKKSKKEESSKVTKKALGGGFDIKI